MSKDHMCLEEMAKKWDGPFERPISWNQETGSLSADVWMVKVYKLTKAGNIPESGGGFLRLNYCPICGEKLIEEE
jgi:hypothetical protein